MKFSTILDYWFGSNDKENYQERSNTEIAHTQSSLWWQKQDATDTDIRQRFEPILKAITVGEYDHWLEDPQGRLAIIIVLDQFTRNMYRGLPETFAYDALALHLCLQGIKQGQDKQLSLIERVFFYLPLEHSESIKMQHLSIEKFQQIADEASDEFASSASGFLDFAHKHKVIIERFNRYPHRNEILKRASTNEELAFLQEPGSSF